MYRFLVENIKFNNEISLDNKDLYFQLTKVLRIRLKDEIILFSSKIKKDFVYNITEVKKDKINLILKKIIIKKEQNIDLVLYQALPNKITKIEYILQKSVEVGFSKIVFFKGERSQKLNISDNKLKRFKKIVLEATEQSNRNSLLAFEIIDNLDIKDLPQNSENIIFHQINTKESIKIKDLKINKNNIINIFIGPEGGFSETELKKFNKISKYKIYLGNNILRTETAGIVTGFFLLQNL